MDAHVAYIVQGALKVRAPDGRTRDLPSPYAEHVRERRFEIKRRQEWKHSGPGARFAGGMALLDQLEQEASAPIRVSALSRGPEPGDVAYAIESVDVGGVFSRQVVSELGDERRLFHQAGLNVQGLALRPGSGDYAYAKAGELDTMNLAMYRAEGIGFPEVTGGDSVDTAPSWSADGSRLLFQSAGVGRDAAGYAVAHGPVAIEELEVDRGEVVTVAEDPDHDFLAPRLAPDGSLLCIRRPYTPPHRRTAWWRNVVDVVLVPFRIAFAIFGWLSLFTARYTGKPLTPAGGPPGLVGPDPKEMWIQGNVVNAQRAARESRAAGDEVPALVPQSWQLVRGAGTPDPEVLARGVLCFDVLGDGSVVYSNGRAIFHLDAAGKRTLLAKGDHHIEALVALEPMPATEPAGDVTA